MTKNQKEMIYKIAKSFAMMEPDTSKDNEIDKALRMQFKNMVHLIAVRFDETIPKFDKEDFIRRCYFDCYK